MATTYYNRVYLGTGSSYTTSTNSIAITAPVSGNGFRFVSANPSDPTYIANGNDVAGTLTWVNAAGVVQSVAGVISRHDVASGANNTAFYFVTTGGQAYLLVEPGDEGRYTGNQAVGTNSSGFVSDLNGLLTTQQAQPILGVSDVNVSEGGGYAVFTVTLSNPASGAVTFTPTLASGSATVGADTGVGLESSSDGGANWISAGGGVTIPNGATSVKIRVALTDDASQESSETFQLLTGAVTGGGVINNAGAFGTATISDNDGVVTVGAPDVTNASDTGADDLVTSHGLPVITFTGASGLTIALKGPDGSALTSGAHYGVAYGGGAYTVTLLDAQASPGVQSFGRYASGVATGNPASTTDGAYTLEASNGGAMVTVGSFTIDTTPPSAPTVAPLTTADTMPTLSGTAVVGPGESLTVAVDGAAYTVGDGHLSLTGTTWSLTPGTLAVGNYEVTATVTDTAGNAATDATSSELSVVASTLTVGAPDITTGADTAADDLVTGDGLPVIAFTGDPGLTLSLTGPDGTRLVAGSHYSVAYSGGTYTVTLLDADAAAGAQPFGAYSSGVATANPTATADGIYTLEADNGAVSATVGSFLIDTTAPARPTVAPLSTTSTVPALSGTATLGAGESLAVTVDGITYLVGDGHLSLTGADWSLTPGSLGLGTYSVTATVTDTAGNAASDATSGELVVTSASPLPTPAVTVGAADITSGTDTGPNDLTTANGLPVVTFAGDPGLTITLTGPDNSALSEGVHYSVGYGGGSYTVMLLDAQPTSGVQRFGDYAEGVATGNPAAAADGTYTLVAHNGGASATVGSFVIDTTVPITPSVSPLVTTSTAPTLTGTATVGFGEHLTVTVDGTTYTAGDGHLSLVGTGWSLVPGNIAAGAYPVVATVTDAAGNAASDVTSDELVITTTPLPMLTVGPPDIAAWRDTGADDLTTAHGLPIVTFTGSPGLTITLKGPDGSALVDGVNYSVSYSGGGYTVDLRDASGTGGPFGAFDAGVATGNPLRTADGTYTLEASNGVASTTVGSFVIDTTAPTAPTVVALSTADSPATVTGTATVGSGEVLTVTVDGSTYTVGDGHLSRSGTAWSLVPNNIVPGTYSVTATVTDAAGNTTTDTTSGELVVTGPAPTPPAQTPTPPPAQPPAPIPTLTGGLAPGEGTNAADHVTHQIQPGLRLETTNLLSGGDLVRVLDPAGATVAVQTLSADEAAAGSVTLTTRPMDDGAYTYVVQVIGADGREKASVPITVTVITDQDGVAPSIELIARGGDFNGDGIADWRQNNVVQAPLTSFADFQAGASAAPGRFGAVLAGDVDASVAGGVRLDPGAQLLEVRVIETPTVAPAGAGLTSAVFAFTVRAQAGRELTDLDPSRDGLQTRVVIDLPHEVAADTYLKWDAAAGTWRTFLDDGRLSTYDDGATLVDSNGDGRVDRVVLTFTDGGPGDDDGAANGVIVDPGALALAAQARPVFAVRLANGDRIYTTDAQEAAHVAAGTDAVFEGVRFDSLLPDPSVAKIAAFHQPITGDWDYARSAADLPYACYEAAEGAGFQARTSAQIGDTAIRLYLRDDGTTQLVSQADAAELGLLAQGYGDRGVAFFTTTTQAFHFDADGYLVANAGDASVRDLVQHLAETYHSTADPGFIESVEQHYLQHGVGSGLLHGEASDALHVNSVFGVNFAG